MGVGMGPYPRVSCGNGVEKYVKPMVIAGTGTMLMGIPRAWVKLKRISHGCGTNSLIILQYNCTDERSSIKLRI